MTSALTSDKHVLRFSEDKIKVIIFGTAGNHTLW